MNKISPATLWPDVAPDWILNGPQGLNDFFYKLYKCFVYDDRYMMYVKGLGNTLLLTLFALLLGVALGVIVSLIRVSWDKNRTEMRGFGRVVLGFCNAIAKVYLTVIRGTPVVVQIMIMFFVIFASSRNKILIGCLSFGINSGAYVAEIIRAGIMSIDQGQTEAGSSLGFHYIQTMWYIIAPQMFKNVLPTLANEFITLLKETSIAGYATVMDLTFAGNRIRGVTYSPFMPLIAVALIYLAMVMLLTYFVGKLERRLRQSDNR